MIKVKNLSITNQINTNYRDYALYTLMHRGIPHFDDALTNVQRMIILNTPTSFSKTMSIVGSVISDGYHHGPDSISKSASKLARPWGCSQQILDGDGFFGNSVNSESASPRYTSIALNKDVLEYIKRFKHLNGKDGEGNHSPIHLELPIGLFTTIVGIAVGYKATILPRKPKEIISFLKGTRKSVQPYFEGYTGKISRYNDLPNAWLFEGVCEVDEKKRTVHIKTLPPLMRYRTFVTKLNRILELYGSRIENNTNDFIDIKIIFDRQPHWKDAIEAIIKITKQIVRESIVFIKDGRVLEYDSIEDYLTDFRIYYAKVELKNFDYQIKFYNQEIEFLKAKKAFMEFLKKQKTFIGSDLIEEFLNQYSKEIYSRLDRIPLRKLNKDEISGIITNITAFKKLVTKYTAEYNKKLEYLETVDETYHTKKYASIDIDVEELNEIEVFDAKKEEINGDDSKD